MYTYVHEVPSISITFHLGGGKRKLEWVDRNFFKKTSSITMFGSLIGRNGFPPKHSSQKSEEHSSL